MDIWLIVDSLVVLITTSLRTSSNPNLPVLDFSTVTSSISTISLQLAGVSLIASGSLELRRIFSGEKQQTKEEADCSPKLQTESEAFAVER